MTAIPKPAFESIQIAELCQRLGVPYRHARYVLEEGILPHGVDPAPDRGNHRQLTPAQAFWLGIVLKLKESGVKAPLAAQIADFSDEAVRSLTQRHNWDFRFSPFDGRLTTEYRWFVDVADLTYIRIATDSKTDGENLVELPWWRIGGEREPVRDATPVVIIRLDISQLAALLRGQSHM